MGEYKGKISGIGNSITRSNEITADELATLRNYIFGKSVGIIDVKVNEININEITQVKTEIRNGQLFVIYPENYQGTELVVESGSLYARTDDTLEKITIYRNEGKIFVKGR